jgi:hypothetical protein
MPPFTRWDIGYDPIDNANFFDGAVDEVQIYNYGFSAAEVAALYAQQSAFPGTPGDVWWPLPSMNGNGEDDSSLVTLPAQTEPLLPLTTASIWPTMHSNSTAQAVSSPKILPHSSQTYLTVAFWIKPTEFPGSGEVYLSSPTAAGRKLSIPCLSTENLFSPRTRGQRQCCSDVDSGTPLALDCLGRM